MKKQIIIIGADGFIGRHLVPFMAKNGFDVFPVTRKPCPAFCSVNNEENVHCVVGDINDYRIIAHSLPKQPEACINLAWNGVSPHKRNSTSIQANNIHLCLSAVHLAAEIDAQRFIMPGSTMEYFDCKCPIDEQTAPSPQNAYGAAKIAARFLSAAQCEELKVPFIYAVISGIYSADRTDGNVINYAITTLLRRKRPSFTKLEQIWDYVHIDDVSLAFCHIAERGKAGALYVIGHGDNWPLSQYIYQIREKIDPSLPLGIGDIPYKNGKPPSINVSLDRVREDTGFEPRITFENGIGTVIKEIAKQLLV